MYNEEQKRRFLREKKYSDLTAKHIIHLFENIQRFEEQWMADCCTKTAEELRPMVDKIMGARFRTQEVISSYLRAYGKWCLKNKIPGACDGLLRISFDSSDKIRIQMVQGPMQLQRYLNLVFDPESEETIDILYRCYFWCAFIGIEEEDISMIRSSDVDLSLHTVRIDKNESIYFYYYPKEAENVFQKAVSLQAFRYTHKLYETISRERKDVDRLFRGYKGNTTIKTVQTAIHNHINDAISHGKTEKRLSYTKVKLSGLFYTMYQRECAGFEPEFNRVAAEYVENHPIHNRTDEGDHIRRLVRARELKRDYDNWKSAFSL